MALKSQSPSKHNSFLGRHSSTTKSIPHPASTGFYDHDDAPAVPCDHVKDAGDKMFGTPSPKRRKLGREDYASSPSKTSKKTKSRLPVGGSSTPAGPAALLSPSVQVKKEILDPEDEEWHESYRADGDQEEKKTQLEAALPSVQTDAEAIEAYEAYRAAEAAEKLEEGGRDEDTLEGRMLKRSWERGRSSIYVDAFNLALSTVLEEERHLFDEAEMKVFDYWENLSYEAQYLYVRLFLRKTSAWFRVGKLGYYDDIADVGRAVRELQADRTLPKIEGPAPRFPGESNVPDEAVPLGESFAFAECSDDQITTLNEASSLLLLDELKVLARDAKVGGKNKTELLKNLRRTSGKQRGLGFLRRSETEDSAASRRSTPAPENAEDGQDLDAKSETESNADGASTPTNDHNRDAHFTRKILEQTGKCIRLSLVPLKLFERVHLVFYRSTEWTDKSLTTIILAKISKRNFPEYIVSRSATIFESRSMLLEFEASLRTQFRVDSILEFNGTPNRGGLEEVKSTFEAVYPRWQVLLEAEQRKENSIYESGEGAYLRRFSPAWVYTRIVHKALAILARFKEHLREHDLLCELLDQHLFHAARRGLWYQRKALLEEHYMYALRDDQGRSEEANKKHWKRISLQTCEQGLQDKECHIIYHYDLQKRIKKLEKQLRIPKREQHDFGHVGLLKPRERTIEGTQILRAEPPASLLRRKSSNSDLVNLNRERSVNTPSRLTDTTTTSTPASNSSTPEPTSRRDKTQLHSNPATPATPAPAGNAPGVGGGYSGKTIWLDSLDTDLPVSVESLSLSHYRKLHGWKGFHCESGVLRTLFGLLFHDVLFSVYVPNVFQTPFQTCPLDLHTDAFYGTRISEINARVNQLSNGDAATILRQVWDEHSERRTCIVGVRWDYELTDLLEIVRCWKGEALGTIMRVMAQEYAERGGGVPDLFLWKVHADDDDAEGEANAQQHGYGQIMFVEVKSENDRLSDTQRLWISVLMNAGVEVELCHVHASEVRREDGSVVER